MPVDEHRNDQGAEHQPGAQGADALHVRAESHEGQVDGR